MVAAAEASRARKVVLGASFIIIIISSIELCFSVVAVDAAAAAADAVLLLARLWCVEKKVANMWTNGKVGGPTATAAADVRTVSNGAHNISMRIVQTDRQTDSRRQPFVYIVQPNSSF